LYRAILKEKGIAGKNSLTRRVEQGTFFPQFQTTRTLPNVNYCQEMDKRDEHLG